MKYTAMTALARWGHPGFAVVDDTGREVARSYLQGGATTPDFDGDGVEEYPCPVYFELDSTSGSGKNGVLWMTHAAAARAREEAVLIAAGLNIVAAHLEPLSDED